MLTGVMHVIVDCCDRLLADIDPTETFSLLLDVHDAVKRAHASALRKADGRLTAHKRLRVTHTDKKDGVLRGLVHTLNHGLLLQSGKSDTEHEEHLNVLWGAMKCAQVIHDPTGKIKAAMDELGSKLMSATANQTQVVPQKKNKKNKKNKKKTNRAEAEEVATTTTTRMVDTTAVFLAAECLRAQMALRVSDKDDAWYDRMLPSVVAWGTAREECRTNISVLSTVSMFLKSVLERDVGRKDEQDDDDDDDDTTTTTTTNNTNISNNNININTTTTTSNNNNCCCC